MNKSTKISILVAGILIVLVGVIGVTFAFFSAGGIQDQANTFTSGCLNISLTSNSSSISLSNVLPITDVEGLSGTSYDFTIENTCNTATNYQVNLESLNEQVNSLSANYIKVSLSSDTVGNVISTLSDNTSVTPEIEGSYEAYNLYTGTLNADETKTYHLKLWLDYDATVEEAANKTYSSKINVVANPETQVVDTLEAKFTIKNTTVTSTLTENVTSATYCTTTDNICEPTTTATITNNSYTIELEEKTKEVATALGNLTVNESTTEVVCTRLNGTSKVICSNPRQINTPDFNKTAQANCGGIENCEETNGIYEAKDDDGTSYYYRGTVDNNWVQFGGFYWRIIRINGDGSIRLIYSGNSETGPVQTGEDTQIGESFFNVLDDQSEYVGLKYTIGEQHGQITNSIIFNTLFSWYQSELSNYSSFVDTNVGFCSNRDVRNGSEWASQPNNTLYYSSYERLIANKNPTLECNESDILHLPIGLITADEASFAGGLGYGNNQSFYLNNNLTYWTMTPFWYYSKQSASFGISEGVITFDRVASQPYGVRPVINLKADTLFTGTGTSTDPYVVVG